MVYSLLSLRFPLIFMCILIQESFFNIDLDQQKYVHKEQLYIFLYVFQNIKQCRVFFMPLLCQYFTSIKIQFSTIKSVYVISILLTIVLDGKNAIS